MAEIVEEIVTPSVDPGVIPAVDSAVDPAAAPVEPSVELPILEYVYQPADEAGRLLGGKQVIRYKTPDELAQKLTEQNVSLIRQLRKVTRNNRLGIVENENLPADVDRLPNTKPFEEKPLTTAEKFQLSQDLQDPEKFEAARDRLLESSLGVKPAELREALNQQQMNTNQLLARTNCQVFFERNPNFYICPDNVQTIVDWMTKNQLDPTIKNFELAYTTMRDDGFLLSPPLTREDAPARELLPVSENVVAESQPPAELDARISTEAPSQEMRQPRVPSGLNSRVASNTGVQPTTETGKLTLVDVDKMSSDEYKRRLLTDKEFGPMVNKLEATRPPRPQRNSRVAQG